VDKPHDDDDDGMTQLVSCVTCNDMVLTNERYYTPKFMLMSHLQTAITTLFGSL